MFRKRAFARVGWIAMILLALTLHLGPAVGEAQAERCTTECVDGQWYDPIWYCNEGTPVDCAECWVNCGPDEQ